MSITELINEIISEWSYRVNDGMPNAKNPTHLKELGIVLKEMNLYHIKDELIENLLTEKGKTPEKIKEADKNFTNPILNKEIPYKAADGSTKKGIVGNLLRLPKDSEGRKAAEKLIPPEGSDERDSAMKDLGSEKDGKSTGGDKEKGKEDEKGKDGDVEKGGGEEEKAKAAQSMFDPKADPAMGARMDREKEANAKLAQKDKEADAEQNKKVGSDTDSKETTDKFNPIDSKDVAKEMPQADPDTFAGGSDIPDGVEPEQLKKFNTDIQNVAQQVADAKAKGEPAPNINLCDVTVPGTNLYCDDNLGIPRDEMPQFKGNASPGSRAAGMEADASGEVDTEPVFKEMLKEKGIKTLQTEVPADKLKATQKDLVGAKVVGMMGALEKDPNHPKITAPIYVSRDGYVIDGHHRWAAIVAYNAQNPDKQIPMKTTVLDQDIKDAIPMANKFAEDMGIAAKKADANKEAPSTPSSVGKSGLTDKIKTKIQNWTAKEKAFFERNEGAPGSDMRRSLGETLKSKAAGVWKAIKKGAKHEVEEFKTAGEGVGKFFKGEKLSHHEKKALKAVAIKVATTAIFGAAGGGLHHGVAAFGKHVAMEFIPHVVGETILKGAGRAALFADIEGEAEMDANMAKFAEMVAKGLEEMEITPEMMEQMVDSYNEKKSENPQKEMTEENLQLAHELMLEMIYGFINEATTKSGKFAARSKESNKLVYFDTPEAQKDAVDAGTHTDPEAKTKTKEPVAGADLFDDPNYQNRMAAETPPPAADAAEKESGRQEINSPKTEQERQAMRAFTDKSVTDSLSLTKSDIEKQEKKSKLDLLKKIDAWQKRKDKAKAKGEKFTEKKPSVESKGVGLGSPESRAGESAVVKGTIVLKKDFDKCMAKSKDVNKCYQAAREATKKHLETYLGSDSFLTKEWIDSAMNTLDLIHKEIGFHNIGEIGWDNQEGRALVGSQGHGTSADMFIKMKPDKEYPNGKRLGISLKKDLKVFIFSGGWKKLEGTMQEKGFILGESSKASHYEKRRNEELYQVSNFVETNKDEFCKDFDNLKKNPNRLSSKPATVKSRVADILKLTKATDLSKLKCDTFIQNVMSARPLTGDAMKVIGDMCKTSTNSYLKSAYGQMRAIDREMTDSIADDFDKPENQTVVKKLVRDETHITDILFADNPNLDELKVVYGTDPAIEMKKEELSKLFGVDDLYAKYEAETDPAKKAKIRKKIEDTIDSKIVISRKKGVMSVAINVNGSNGKPSQLPLFEAKIRTRGFGNAPTFEMSQNTFGGISYKYGHTDYNGTGVDSQGNPNKPWSDEDKSIVVLSMLGDITNDFEEDLDSLDEKTMVEIGARLQDLDKIYPNHPKVKLFRKKYLESAKQPTERPVPKTATKKPKTKTQAKAPVKKVVTKKPVKKIPAKAPVKKIRR
jgi:hypothetical protein